MNATYIPEAIEQLKSNIFMHVRHRALLRYTGEPIVDDNQLFFIQLPFLNGELCDEDCMISATTVGIVHTSLVEHDKIHETDATSKEQQLTVLSGDYYSGRYYELLASTGNIMLIQMLSKGIVNRCEHQITVYEHNSRPLSQWIDSLTAIECDLIEQFYNVYGFKAYTPFVKDALTITRLQRELEQIIGGQPSSFGQVLTRSVADYTIEDELQRELMIRTNTLYERLRDASWLKEELVDYIKQMTSSQTDLKVKSQSIVE